MIVLGLTGSIGMGKTVAAEVFRGLGVPVFDADGAVHDFLRVGGRAVAPVGRAFPGALLDGAIDRKKLGDFVFGDDEALDKLESILHPLVREQENAFLSQASKEGFAVVVLEIPLLFETGAERLCDGVVVVSAPTEVQEARVLKRPGMTAEKLAAIRARQMSGKEKKARADFIIDTSRPREENLRVIENIVTVAKGSAKKGLTKKDWATGGKKGA